MAKARMVVRRAPAKKKSMPWQQLAVEGVKPDTSAAYMILRRQYQSAMNGHLPSIRIMLKMIEAADRARAKRAEYEARRALPTSVIDVVSLRSIEAEARANPALLLLGIGLVSNSSMAFLDLPHRSWYESELKRLEPTHIAEWVQEWALARDDCPELNSMHLDNVRRGCASEDDPKFSEWRERKDLILSEIVKLRGPAGHRFKPGESGNKSGRPKKKKVYGYPEDEPLGAFFSEMVTVTIHHEEEKTTRLNALMLALVKKAALGDEKIGTLLEPQLIEAFLQQWEGRFEHEPVVYESRI